MQRHLGIMVLLATLLALPVGPLLASQETPSAPSDWERTGLAEPTSRLFAPTGGGLFARTRETLLRSDDQGTSWTALRLPESAKLETVTVDPRDSRFLYVAGADGLYTSDDGGASWRLMGPLPQPELVGFTAVSPADHRLVYRTASFGQGTQFHRSRDGGATWDTLEPPRTPAGNPCSWSVQLLMPHPTDTQRVFLSRDCRSSRDRTRPTPLLQSRDQGATFLAWYTPPSAIPELLLGGDGSMPDRYYLAAVVFMGRVSLHRTDDDGANWSSLLTLPEGATVGGLAYVPTAPDRVFLGLAGTATGVQASTDGGANWADLGLQAQGAVRGLAVSPDGAMLYAATDLGVWRRRVDGAGRPAPQTVPTATAAGAACPCVYAALRLSDRVAILDRENRLIGEITLDDQRGVEQVAVSADGRQLYVTHQRGSPGGPRSGLAIVDVASRSLVGDADLPAQTRPAAVAMARDGRRAYVAYASLGREGGVAVVDVASAMTVNTISMEPAPNGIALTPDGTRAYVTVPGSPETSSLAVIDTAAGMVAATVPLECSPRRVALAGRRVYAACPGSLVPPNTSQPQVVVVDADSNVVVGSVPIPQQVEDVAVNPAGTRVYAAYNGGVAGSGVVVIDPNGDSIAARWTTPRALTAIAVSADGARVYGATVAEGTVAVVDTTTGTVVASVGVGREVNSLATSP